MMPSNFYLRRLRVMQNARVAYDEQFHRGLNIIRGENGSGKSTIADFIFYVLGGEFDRWKPVAKTCTEVQAEVETSGGILTIKRAVGDKLTKPEVFFGPFDEAQKHGVDGWHRYPLRRQDSSDSFSQILFRSAGIPEAKSQGTSNITIHQLLRLMYSDQRTAPGFLFKYEDWDPREIREAVGDLLCGLSVYDKYDLELQHRELSKLFDEKSSDLAALLKGFQGEGVAATTASIDAVLSEIASEKETVLAEITNVDVAVAQDKNAEFLANRSDALKALNKVNSSTKELSSRIAVLDLELSDLEGFISYLGELSEKLPRAELTADLLGAMEFTHCPACLQPLQTPNDHAHCVVCGQEIDPEKERARYLQLRLDVEFQLRESRQLLDDKGESRDALMGQKREGDRTQRKLVAEFSANFELASSPREAYLAARNQRLGNLERQEEQLGRLRERALKIEGLSADKAELQARLTTLADRLSVLGQSGVERRRKAMQGVNQAAIRALREDWRVLRRQEEFANPTQVSLKFADNAITVDGEMNFAESSNVVVKNSAILALLIAAATDVDFNHPRFAMFDNIEDKGMEMPRTHNFQRVIKDLSASAKIPHQIIITTSMVNPELDVDSYTVGPRYTHERKSLALG